ncbi:MAG: hypothetical protein GWN01_13890 [Nitrosopumilaceae archaeon]|nr:hypothetical protein [Nitrosopumilaceae archaeon]NIU88360.1 hypothetical protein [Nitrosopumilaceae archaeon]NIX62555.1 hypothetical protein [Nitrosopumilaceae archaeon]
MEMFIFSYATQISGNCEQGVLSFPNNVWYEYMPETQALLHLAGDSFPMNEQLEMIFAQQRIWPLSLLGSLWWKDFVGVYSVPNSMTSQATVVGITDSEVELTINLKYFKKTIVVAIDSTFTEVTKTIEEGPGEDCIREYTDSLVVRNYGFIPKKNFVRKF